MQQTSSPFNRQKVIVIFTFSIPLFFLFALCGLYFIKMEDHVIAKATSNAQYIVRLYCPEDAQLMLPTKAPGTDLQKGEVLVSLQQNDLQHAYQDEHYNLAQLIQKKAIRGSDTPLLDIQIAQLQARLKQLQKRLSSLTITTPIQGRIISAPKHVKGEPLSKGLLLASIADPQLSKIDISIYEKDIHKIQISQKVRFESSTFSANKSFNSYYSGTITSIDLTGALGPDNRVYYQVEAFLDTTTTLPEIPRASTGNATIIIGRRSILLQLIGWE